MSWNLFGLNPTFKEFLEKHPDATMIGLCWSMYWRLGVLVMVLELLFFIAILLLPLFFRITFF